jgi:hypothetical protein
VTLFVWVISFNLSGMGGIMSVILRIIGHPRPHYFAEVEVCSGAR